MQMALQKVAYAPYAYLVDQVGYNHPLLSDWYLIFLLFKYTVVPYSHRANIFFCCQKLYPLKKDTRSKKIIWVLQETIP